MTMVYSIEEFNEKYEEFLERMWVRRDVDKCFEFNNEGKQRNTWSCKVYRLLKSAHVLIDGLQFDVADIERSNEKDDNKVVELALEIDKLTTGMKAMAKQTDDCNKLIQELRNKVKHDDDLEIVSSEEEEEEEVDEITEYFKIWGSHYDNRAEFNNVKTTKKRQLEIISEIKTTHFQNMRPGLTQIDAYQWNLEHIFWVSRLGDNKYKKIRYLLPRKADRYCGGQWNICSPAEAWKWEERETMVVELKQEGVNWADRGFQYTFEQSVGGGGTKRNSKGGYESETRVIVKRGLYSNIVSVFDPDTNEELTPEQIEPTCIYERRDKHTFFTILRAPQWRPNKKDGKLEEEQAKQAKKEADEKERSRLATIAYKKKMAMKGGK